jgi:hypothetical protein
MDVTTTLQQIQQDLSQLTMNAKIGSLKYQELFKLQREFEAFIDSLLDVNDEIKFKQE